MNKIYVEVKVQLIINKDNDISIQDILDEMDYSFKDTTTKADIVDTQILDYEVVDSK